MQVMADESARPEGSSHRVMRILVIEDDREAASWLIKGLTESGHVADRSEEHTSELQSQ